MTSLNSMSILAAHGKGQGQSRRAPIPRPVTPTSKTQFVFRTPQASMMQRSHSLSRQPSSGTQLRMPMQPIPIPQSVSWNASLSVVPRSAKKWARTAHLHEVKSAKNAKKVGKMKEREKVDVPIGLEWDLDTNSTSLRRKEREDAPLTGRSKGQEVVVVGLEVDGSNDVFITSSLSQRPSSTLILHDGCGDARIISEAVANGSSPESTHDIHGVNNISMITQEMSLQDESDPWVDTDSVSVGDDDHEDTFRVSHSTSPFLCR